METRNKDGLTEKEFLAAYDTEKYKKPSVTVDMLVFSMSGKLDKLRILLIQRANHPYINCFALPGGFIEMDESAYEAACRELKEETGLEDIYFEQLYTMSQPDRDPRMRVIDISYMALIKESAAVAGDDAKEALWFDINYSEDELELFNEEHNITISYSLKDKIFHNGKIQIKNKVAEHKKGKDNAALAFDHVDILLEGLMRLRNKVEYTDVAFNLLDDMFTLPDLQRIYEIILGKELYKKNFRTKIKDKVIDCNTKIPSITGRKTSQAYRYRQEEEL